jgi:carboxypeptidase family protein
MTMTIRTWLRGLLLAFLCACAAPSALAQGVGAISGTIADSSGGKTPGVTVTLSSPGIIGGNQLAVTDDRGAYQFTRLVPATYAVRAELAGFQTVVREGVVVNADVTVRVDLVLQVGALAETLTVTGEAPLLDTSSALNQAVLDRAVLDTLPQGRDLWSIGRMVPGVVPQRYDVGGSNALVLTHTSVHGSLVAESGYHVDGVEMSSAFGDGGSKANGWDTNMFQEVNYQLGNASAEYQKGGVVYNMVTRTGTNQFRGTLSFTGTNDSLQADNVTSDLLRDLRLGVPALALQANPDVNPAAKVLRLLDTAQSLSGPLVRNRMWFTATGNFMQIHRYAIGSYDLDGTQYVEDFSAWTVSGKVSWQMSPKNQLHYTHIYNRENRYHLSFIREFMEGRATYRFEMPSQIDQVRWTTTLSSSLLLDAGAAFMRNMWPQGPQAQVQHGDIPRFDAITRQHTVAQGTYDRNPGYAYPASASLTWVRGGHNVKTGYQFARRMDSKEAVSMSHFPAGLRAIYRNGAPDSVNTYNTPTTVQAFVQDHGVFVQDNWQATRRLALNIGLRVQKTRGWVPPTCQAQTIFISGQCFSKIDDNPDWLDPAPRFALIYDLRGDGRTALKFAANRYSLGIGAAHPNRVNPIRVTNDTRPWTDRNRDLIPQLDELGASTGFNLGTTNRYSPDLERPIVNELSIELEHQFPGNLVMSAGYFRRETRHNIGARNVAVPFESYIPLLVTERSSGRQVTVYNQDPALRGRFDVLWDNYDELDANFNGADFAFNKRLNNHWMLMGGLSIGRNEVDTYGGADLNNPNNTFRNGLDQRDVPVSFKLNGIYQAPYGITLSGTLQHFTGFPEPATVSVSSDTVTLTQVTQNVRVAEVGTTRLPDNNMLDFSVRKNFALGNGRTISPVLEVFNATNANTIQSRLTQLGPAYQRVTAIQFPRMWRFGFNVSF